jgi:hypothetical protein
MNYTQQNSSQSSSVFNAGIDKVDQLYRNKLIEVTTGMFKEIAKLVHVDSTDAIFNAMQNNTPSPLYPLSCIRNIFDVYNIASASSEYLSQISNGTKAHHSNLL